MARLFTTAILIVFAIFVAGDHFRRMPQDAPWTPLDLDAPLGWSTESKLAELPAHPAGCRALLAAAKVEFDPVAARSDGPGCSLAAAGRVRGLSVQLDPAAAIMSCPLAAAMAVYVRHIVIPTAAAIDERAAALTSFGTYNCRRIAGSSRLSRHATADAIDLAGVRLSSGEIIVARDWHTVGRRGRAVRALRDGACRLFGVVLSPDYNAAHRDHLHLEAGPGRVCR